MPNYPQSPAVARLFRRGRPLYFPRGSLILGIDPQPNGVYYIDTGYVTVYSITDDGEQYVHVIYGHGEIFPLVWAYWEIQAELFYEALGDALVWRISREQFSVFATTNAVGGYGIARQMAQQFHLYSDRLDNLEYKKSSERVAYRLLLLAARFGSQSGRSTTIDAPITHDLIARSINLARESVSREIEKFEQQQILEHKNHRIIIKDINRLRSQLSEPAGLKHWGLAD